MKTKKTDFKCLNCGEEMRVYWVGVNPKDFCECDKCGKTSVKYKNYKEKI